jgi:DNA-binding transcriptional regulator YiaG
MALQQYLREAEHLDVTNKAAFSQMVREGRRLTGASLRQVAHDLSTAPGTVSRWENNLCAPPTIARQEIIKRFTKQVRRIDNAHLQ